MEALTLSIKSNDVIIFGLSDNFAENPECKKLLLYTKEVLQRPILLLLLGKTKNWRKGELNMPLGDEVSMLFASIIAGNQYVCDMHNNFNDCSMSMPVVGCVY